MCRPHHSTNPPRSSFKKSYSTDPSKAKTRSSNNNNSSSTNNKKHRGSRTKRSVGSSDSAGLDMHHRVYSSLTNENQLHAQGYLGGSHMMQELDEDVCSDDGTLASYLP